MPLTRTAKCGAVQDAPSPMQSMRCAYCGYSLHGLERLIYPGPDVEASAQSGYSSGLNAVENCRDGIMKELGLFGETTDSKS